MAVLKQKLNRKNESGTYDEIHLKTDATVISLSPTDETLLSDEISNLKSSVSNGKSLIASAITDKGVSTASDATFQTMANNISSLAVYDPTKLNFSYTGQYKERVGGAVEFLTSGKLTIYNDTVVDLFLVGGGGSGGAGTYGRLYGGGYLCRGSRGGGSGYTNTIKAVIIPTGEYDVIIGAGGSAISGSSSPGKYLKGNDGGKTSILGYVANGGIAGSNVTQMVDSVQHPTTNGNGGSGGGACTYHANTGAGGSDGSDGYDSISHDSSPKYKCGKGQGTTTREFGESSGRLYAGGGGGARYFDSTNSMLQGPALTLGGEGGGGNGGIPSNTTAGAANTGGGGGSGVNDATYKGAAGGSGIVIMRIAK